MWASGLGRGGHSMLRGTGSPRGTAGQGSWCPHRVRAASTRGGAAAVGGGVLYRRVNQTGENTKAEGSGFSLLEKRVTNVEKEKSRMNSVISDWDWKNCCEHTISNTQRHRNGHRYVRVPVCTHPCLHQSVRLELQEQPRPQREEEPGWGSFGKVADCRAAAEEDDAVILLGV